MAVTRIYPEYEVIRNTDRCIACYNEFDPGKTQRNCVAQRLKPKLQ